MSSPILLIAIGIAIGQLFAISWRLAQIRDELARLRKMVP